MLDELRGIHVAGPFVLLGGTLLVFSKYAVDCLVHRVGSLFVRIRIFPVSIMSELMPHQPKSYRLRYLRLAGWLLFLAAFFYVYFYRSNNLSSELQSVLSGSLVTDMWPTFLSDASVDLR